MAYLSKTEGEKFLTIKKYITDGGGINLDE